MEPLGNHFVFSSREELFTWLKDVQKETHTSFVSDKEKKQFKNDGKL